MRRTAIFFSLLSTALPSLAAYYSKPSDLPTLTYDYIIVGGGAAGSIIANRLSEDSGMTVLVIEAGVSHLDVPNTEVPLLATGLAPHTTVDWNYTTTAQSGLNGRSIDYPRGKILGGSASINYMVYNCGSKDDYDWFAKVTGDNGWSWNSIQQYRAKVEKFVPPADGHNTAGQYDPSAHSTTGMVSISLPGYPSAIGNYIKQTTTEMPNEFPFQLDQNSGNMIGVGWMQATIGNGRRSSSANTYIGQYITRSNLHVLVKSQVTKVVQGGTLNGLPRITGVDFAPSANVATTRATARHEIILSAGSFNSPQLLMLSGIGPKSLLTSLGITTIVDNPSVGQNLTDHVLLPNVWTTAAGDTLNDYLSGSGYTSAMNQWTSSKTGPMASSLGAQVGWLRLNKTDPIFNQYADPSTGPTSAHYELIFANGLFPLAGQTPATGDYLTIFTNVVSPFARGNVTISTSNPWTRAIVNPNLLGHPFDIHTIVASVKAARKFLTGSAWAGYITGTLDSSFAAAQTDAQIEQYARNNAATVWHATGTAAMSPKGAKWGVLDPDMKVKGVMGLRVIDASSYPYVPNGHPTGSYYILAERGAALIKADRAAGII